MITDLGAQSAGAFVASRDWFDGQPAEVQEALREGAKAYTAAFIAEQSEVVSKALENMEKSGATITRLSPEERARWAESLPHIADAWVKDADSKGLPASQVLDAYIAILKEAGVSLGRDWSVR